MNILTNATPAKDQSRQVRRAISRHLAKRQGHMLMVKARGLKRFGKAINAASLIGETKRRHAKINELRTKMEAFEEALDYPEDRTVPRPLPRSKYYPFSSDRQNARYA